MSRYNDDWRETNHYVGRFLGLTLKVWIIVTIAVLAVGAGIWGLTVATSGIKAQGDGIIRNNSADNWIAQQGKFEDLYAEYESTQVRIDQFKAVAEASPNDAISQTNYQGQVSHCTDVVAEYNAATRSFLSEDWKSIDLPATLDPADCTR